LGLISWAPICTSFKKDKEKVAEGELGEDEEIKGREEKREEMKKEKKKKKFFLPSNICTVNPCSIRGKAAAIPLGPAPTIM